MMEQFRKMLPALQRTVNGKRIVYCDWAATTQVPQCVVDAVGESMKLRGGIRRGVHNLGADCAEQFEQGRRTIAQFVGADPSDIQCTSGTTDGLNRLVQSLGNTLARGDVVLLSAIDHHAHLLPWQKLSAHNGFAIKIVPMDEQGRLDLIELNRLLSQYPVRVVGFPLLSNVLGTVQSVRDVLTCIKESRRTVRVIVDAAQAVAHMPLHLNTLGVDAAVFGGHKVYGPDGIGVLWMKPRLRRALLPSMLGGGAIETVTYNDFQLAEGVRGFEPGSPNMSGVIGLSRAVEWLQEIGWERIQRHESVLRDRLIQGLSTIPKLKLLTQQPDVPLCTFEIDGVHAHDVGTLLDAEGIVVRTGHHCTQPFHDAQGIESSTRISLSFLNTVEEVDTVVAHLNRIVQVFA